MKKGNKKLDPAFAAIVALGGIILSPFASAQDSQTQTKLSNDYQKAVEIIRQNYVADLDQETLTKAAIQGMLKSLDPHSDYGPQGVSGVQREAAQRVFRHRSANRIPQPRHLRD